MAGRIRVANESDARGIQRIYAPIVEKTPISFELEVPTVSEMKERIQKTLVQYPWLVCEKAGNLVGYVYASTHRARLAYQWTTEVTVYVDQDFRGQGIGKALYQALFELLKRQGYRTAVGGITLPNASSCALHGALGFKKVAVFSSIGYKHGAWHDVGFWQLELQPYDIDPPAPIPFAELSIGEPFDRPLK